MKEIKKKHRYKSVNGKRLIEVRVKSPYQLFDARDPAPFRDRDLDDDFVEYILSSLNDFKYSTPIKIVIHVEDSEPKELTESAIFESIQSYFTYQIDLKRNTLNSFFKRAQMYLLMGIVILVICLSLAQNISQPNQPGIMSILREGLVIIGWVSAWKPIEFLLFDWYPIYEQLQNYKKIKQSEVQILFNSLTDKA